MGMRIAASSVSPICSLKSEWGLVSGYLLFCLTELNKISCVEVEWLFESESVSL